MGPADAGGAVLYFLQLAVVYLIALLLGDRHLETAILLGPLSFVGIPFNLNPPSQLEPVPVAIVLPLNASFLFPWMVSGFTWLLLG